MSKHRIEVKFLSGYWRVLVNNRIYKTFTTIDGRDLAHKTATALVEDAQWNAANRD